MDRITEGVDRTVRGVLKAGTRQASQVDKLVDANHRVIEDRVVEIDLETGIATRYRDPNVVKDGELETEQHTYAAPVGVVWRSVVEDSATPPTDEGPGDEPEAA